MPGTEIVTDKVAYPPKFGSPTALGIRIGKQIFISGMLPWDVNRKVVGVGDIRAQTRQVLRNIEATLEAVGATLRNIVKINFYLTDIRDKDQVWEVRKEMFQDHRPASTLVEVNHLVDPQAKLEVEATAFLEE